MRASGGRHSAVVAGQLDGLAPTTQIVERCQMQGAERSHRNREPIEGSRQHWRRQLQQREATDESLSRVAMGARHIARVNTVPELVLQQPAGDKRVVPQRSGRAAILCKERCERDGRVEIDHRSARSSSSSAMSASSGATGAGVGGGPAFARAGGVNRPRRTSSARSASARIGLLSTLGGTISATTRSRSVTSTVSPDAAKRMYSLSLLFRTFRPTVRIERT